MNAFTKGEVMTVVTFKTKTEVFEFLQYAKGFGVKGSIVPLPKEIKIGCGLCVKIAYADAYKCYALIAENYFPTFNGIYTLKKVGGKTVLAKNY